LAKTKPRSSISIYHPQTPKGKINHAATIQKVTLARDVPEYNLKQGDSAILVDIVAHPKGGEEGYVLELFNEVEESVNVSLSRNRRFKKRKKKVLRYLVWFDMGA